VADRHFGREEVEALIPRLSEIMGGVMALHREVTEAKERLKDEQQRIAVSGGGVLDRAMWAQDSERVADLGRRIEAELERLTTLGGVPKDLELGLVDFPHLRDGRIVNLCWKHGENRIGYWHGLDEGYAARKPL
jgi:hypothetical protein